MSAASQPSASNFLTILWREEVETYPWRQKTMRPTLVCVVSSSHPVRLSVPPPEHHSIPSDFRTTTARLASRLILLKDCRTFINCFFNLDRSSIIEQTAALYASGSALLCSFAVFNSSTTLWRSYLEAFLRPTSINQTKRIIE